MWFLIGSNETEERKTIMRNKKFNELFWARNFWWFYIYVFQALATHLCEILFVHVKDNLHT